MSCDLSVHFEPVGERTIRVTFADPKVLERAKLANDDPDFTKAERLMKFFDRVVNIPFTEMYYDGDAFYLVCEIG